MNPTFMPFSCESDVAEVKAAGVGLPMRLLVVSRRCNCATARNDEIE